MLAVKRKWSKHTTARCHQHTRKGKRKETKGMQAIEDKAARVSPCLYKRKASSSHLCCDSSIHRVGERLIYLTLENARSRTCQRQHLPRSFVLYHKWLKVKGSWCVRERKCGEWTHYVTTCSPDNINQTPPCATHFPTPPN